MNDEMVSETAEKQQDAGYIDRADIPSGHNQYEGRYDLTDPHPIVKAIYVKQYGAGAGNPLVEALPVRISPHGLMEAFSGSADIPDWSVMREMDEQERADCTLSLFDMKMFLPYYGALYSAFGRAIKASYLKRYIKTSRSESVSVTLNGVPCRQHSQIEPLNVSDAVSGFNLIGISGSGKTTGINGIIHLYPQTIIHHQGGWDQQYQVLYLYVNCAVRYGDRKPSIKNLYISFGQELDKALGNFTPVYEQLMKKNTEENDYSILKQCIQRFAIGEIIFDEIQVLSQTKNMADSFNMFLTLANETGVAISVVGTQEAYSHLFSTRKLARRSGDEISANAYSVKYETFEAILDSLLLNQFTPDPVELSDDVRHRIFNVTGGIVSDLVTLYSHLENKLLASYPFPSDSPTRAHEKLKKGLPKVTVGMIDRIVREHMDGLVNATMKEKYADIMTDSNASLAALSKLEDSRLRNDIKRYQEMFDTVSESEAYKQYEQLKHQVVAIVKNQKLRYRQSSIERTFDYVMHSLPADSIPNAGEIALMVIAHLKAKNEKMAEPVQKKIDIESPTDNPDAAGEPINIAAMQGALKDNQAQLS